MWPRRACQPCADSSGLVLRGQAQRCSMRALSPVCRRAQLSVSVVRAGQHATLAVHPADGPASAQAAAPGAPARCHSAHAARGGGAGGAARGAGQGGEAGAASLERQATGQGGCVGAPAAESDGGWGARAADRLAAPDGRAASAELGAAELQRLRQQPLVHPNEAYREPQHLEAVCEPPRSPKWEAGEDSPRHGRNPAGCLEELCAPPSPRPSRGARGAAADFAGNLEVSNTNGSGRGHPGDPPPLPPPPAAEGASAAAGVPCSASPAGACSGSRPLPRPARGARTAAADFAGNLEFSNTNGSGRGHPGDPPPPPPPPEGASAGASAGGLQWAPEPARWELRSRSAPLAGAAAAACSPPNSRKARPNPRDLGRERGPGLLLSAS